MLAERIQLNRSKAPGRVGSEGSEDRVSELRLVKKMIDGDREAFESFVRHYSPGLHRYARAHLRDDAESVQDLVQMTLIAAMEQLMDYRSEGPLGAWLIGICRFQIAAYRRRAFTRLRFSGGRVDDFDQLKSGEPSVEHRMDEDEEKAMVHSALELLPPPYGDVLRWKYLLDEPVRRIADRLGVSAKAAESLLTRARRAFGKIYDLGGLKP